METPRSRSGPGDVIDSLDSAPISFDGQVVVITGAGRGIGRAHALEFANLGGAIIVCDVLSAHADEVVDAIRAMGGRAIPCYESVATPEGGAAIIEAAVKAFGTLDVLVNNAGFLRTGYFEDLTLAQIDAVLDVHLRSCFFVTQPAWRIMKAKRYGRVIMTSSSSGMFSHQGLANYAAAKAGVYGLTKALAYEGAEFGITCNAILPYAQTTISEENPIPDFESDLAKFLSDGDTDQWAARSTPETISPLVAFLASRTCQITGEAFSICAGRYARVFVGVADGWLADDSTSVSPEDIRGHLGQIRDVSKYVEPKWLFDELVSASNRINSH